MINKQDFINVIADIEKVYRYHENVNDFLRKNNVEGYIFQPDCSSTVIMLLHIMFGENDKNDWINYFCNEIDFGHKWVSGMIKDKDGSDIKLKNSGDLYDLLLQQST
jgi:hypothetical protein